MTKRIILPAAAALALGAFVALPAPAHAASLASPFAATQLSAEAAAEVIQVHRPRRWRRAWRRWHAPRFAYYYPPHCHYIWRPHRGRVVVRCW